MQRFVVAVLMMFFVGLNGVVMADGTPAIMDTGITQTIDETVEVVREGKIQFTQEEIKSLKKALIPRPPAPAPKTLCDNGDVLCVVYRTKAGPKIIAAATKRDLLRASKRDIDGLNRFMGLLSLLQAEASESEYVALAKKHLPRKWLQ